MASIVVSEERCKGCGICLEACPAKVYVLSQRLSSHGVHVPLAENASRCTVCRMCELMCPDFALTVCEQETPAQEENTAGRREGFP